MRLRAAISTPYHLFVPDSVSLLDDAVVDCRRLLRPRQLTDVYLLALAVERRCRLVTFDTVAARDGSGIDFDRQALRGRIADALEVAVR